MSDELNEQFAGPSEARKKIDKLKAMNDATFLRIDKLGGSIDMASVQATRDAHLLGYIYQNLLTEAQREDFLISWHTELGEQLTKMEGQAREQIIARDSAKRRTQLVQGTPAQYPAGTPQLILPPNARRPGS